MNNKDSIRARQSIFVKKLKSYIKIERGNDYEQRAITRMLI